MSTWDRINKLEMELAQAHAQIRRLEGDLVGSQLDHAHALGTLNRVTQERDTARRVAVRLEQENHELALDTVLVPVWGEAR